MKEDKIIDFYKNATIYEKLTSLAYEKKTFHKRYPFDFISIEQIKLKENTLSIEINKQMQMYLLNKKGRKGIAPIYYTENKDLTPKEKLELKDFIIQELFEKGIEEDSPEWKKEFSNLEVKCGLKVEKNELLFSPIYLKVFFHEEDSMVYIPLLTLNITEFKEDIYHHNYKEKPYILNIDLENTELEYNNFAIEVFMKESFKEIQNSILYIANSEGITSAKELFEKIYNNIEKHLLFKENDMFSISFPKIDYKKEPIGLFFKKIDNVEIIESYENIKRNKNSLLSSYLLNETDINHKYELTEDIFYGSFTESFPLGEGQSIVMNKNQNNEELISVIGPPGSGKTTLFLSIIANNVVKRAISNIYHNKDYNNLMLITSTSNKAVENVYVSLKNKFSIGFCYIGGNFSNRKKSGEEIVQLIEYLKSTSYKEGTLEKLEKDIRNNIEKIEKEKNAFFYNKKLLEEKFGIRKTEELSYLKTKEISNEEINEAIEILNDIEEIRTEINNILNKNYSIEDLLKFVETIDYKLIIKTAIKLNNVNILLEWLNIDKYLINKLNIEKKDFIVKDKEHFLLLAQCLKTIRAHKKEIQKSLEIKSLHDTNKYIESIDKNYIKKILSYKSFGDYFRKELYKINYNLFILSKLYLEQKALKYKYETIEALEFLASGDMYAIKDTKSFLEALSRMYPVVTSTLAGFKYMFRNLDTYKVYDTILADEAGMIKVQDILPLLIKSKRAVIIGDPKQLPPIVTMHTLFEKYLKKKTDSEDFFYQFSPTKVSAYHRAAGTKEGGYKSTGFGVLLEEHRRCQKEIADLFINVAEYQDIKIRTQEKNIKEIYPFTKRTVFFNVIDRNKKDLHINYNEIDTIEEIVNILNESNNFDIEKDIGIITPYNKQEAELIKRIGDKIGHTTETKKIGTIHKFQGSEYKVIIFSPVVSAEEDSLKFINKDPSMVNVAISRAKELFIVVGDYEKIEGTESRNYIGRMTHNMKDHIVSTDSFKL